MNFDVEGSLAQAREQNAEGCVKTTVDLARYRAIIARYRPDHILECGTFSGKSAVWFARTAGCPVTTIDVDQRNIDRATWRELKELDVVAIKGRSVAHTTIELVFNRWRRLGGTPARLMVVLDSDHSASTVTLELNTWATLVPAGGYCVVEDSLVRWMPWEQQPQGPYTGSPMDAIEAWLEAHPGEWEVDEEIDGMYPTGQFPKGWLRRAR